MTARELLQQLHDAGIRLTPYPDGTLRYKAPRGTLTPELLAGLRQHKEALHAMVETFEERAAIAESCAGLPRGEAERRAWECVLEAPAHADPGPLVTEGMS